MNTDNKNQSKIYDQLPTGIINDATTSEFRSEKIIKDLICSTIPTKDLKLTEKKQLYLNISKYVPPKKKKRNNQKRNKLSRKDKLKLGVLKCPKAGWNYEDFEPLRSMWKEHMRDVLDLVSGKKADDISSYNKLVSKADLHGAEVRVERSKNPSLVGISGTVVHESRDTFGIVSGNNKYRTIPKEPCVFGIVFDGLKIVIFGKYLLQRTAERSVKKVKSFLIPSL